ncbi:hypothetical protein E2C01_021573 [Portunus trituberculatus]|uniref:Uncharacterized protein n=1 Tax=Portunus trituberculatus TaxID=210409 RepID=A0A5B7E327_PORTR|nr:hypothetical protein [Portunus trituberculatus]
MLVRAGRGETMRESGWRGGHHARYSTRGESHMNTAASFTITITAHPSPAHDTHALDTAKTARCPSTN